MPKKSQFEFFKTQVEYLGKIIDVNGISIKARKVQDVGYWPIPSVKGDFQAFLTLLK